MSTAFFSIDIINKAINIFTIACIILKCDFYNSSIFCAIEIYGLWIDYFFITI